MELKEKLLKIAEENVNKNLEEIKQQHEARIKRELKDVEFVLELIEKKMLYKVVGERGSSQRFVMITKEKFLEDYMSEPKSSYNKKGITIKNWDWAEESYDLEITINSEIRYKHIGKIIKDFTETLSDKSRTIEYITKGLWDLKQEFEELVNQEKNIMKFVQDYEEAKKIINQ